MSGAPTPRSHPDGPVAVTSDVRPPKVAIVVPVYNPGPELERCVASVLAQTMPPGELEAIFVDDGSTDGSGELLDRLAGEHPHVRVIHEPNSGWAGRPRNVGIDAATAEFVLFLDHDDALGPEAASRLYARAVADGSDVVLGRSVGHGKPNESSRDWATRGPVTFEQAPELIAHLKPHKLVRREFLDARGLGRTDVGNRSG
jgi:glycosyltransferase involved in cell wall biosynthesis